MTIWKRVKGELHAEVEPGVAHCGVSLDGVLEKDVFHKLKNGTKVCADCNVESMLPSSGQDIPPPPKTADTINHPPHYCMGNIEVIDAIETWGLGYHLGNVVKYVARADYKGQRLEDLKKARWYLNRLIESAKPR